MSNTVPIYFILQDGTKVEVQAIVGLSVLEAAHRAKEVSKERLEGACEGSLACSTCHVYLEDAEFAKFPEKTDDEEDMLDLAFAVKHTSRLSCQLMVSPEIAGFTFTLPKASRNNH